MPKPDPGGGEPSYTPLDFVVVRAPLLPVESYQALHTARIDALDSPTAGASDAIAALCGENGPLDVIRRALAVGSWSLYTALDRPPVRPSDGTRRQGRLLRYLIRMATRPTPYALFAGVALVEWGVQTDLALSAAPPRVRTRPDMEWLMRLVLTLEADGAIRSHLRLVTNPETVLRAARHHLAECAPGLEQQPVGANVRATGVAQRALALAHRPLPYTELRDKLLAETPDATLEQVEGLLATLWQHTFLLTDLRPPLTSDNPAQYVLQRLRAIPPVAPLAAQLRTLLAEAAAWDARPPADGAATYHELVALASATGRTATETPFDVDMVVPLAGRRLAQTVGRDAARAAELLLRLTPLPDGLPSLAVYRQVFVERYGQQGEAPLLELLHPDFGLGPPVEDEAAAVRAPDGRAAGRAAARQRALIELASRALREREMVVHLDDATLARLETCALRPDNLPTSLDLNVAVAASSAAAIDAGDYQIVVGPTVGAAGAGRYVGRFAMMLGPEAQAALTRMARAEEAHQPDHVWADVVYLPRHFRSANVAVRPLLRGHALVVGADSTIDDDRVIPLDEVVVGVRDDRFYLRWSSRDLLIQASAGHMLNPAHAPALGRFLTAVSHDGLARLRGFDWGPAEDFPFLPRVQVDRIVLRPAQWRLQRGSGSSAVPCDDPTAFRTAMAQWRAHWQAPRHVYLSTHDNRLLLDLEQQAQLEELRADLRRADGRDGVILQEVLPRLDQTWLPGPGGHFMAELIVPLVRRGQPSTHTRGEPWRAAPATMTTADRLRPPGSEWLYVRLYGPRILEDDLIAWCLRLFAGAVLEAAWADDWFFIRYIDPHPHVRLRFHGTAADLTTHLMPALCDWAGQLVAAGLCARFSLETYDRELERYGGRDGASAAEALFGADSRAVAALLHLIQTHAVPVERSLLAVLTVDDLLAGLGISAPDRVQWYRRHVEARHEVGAAYRRHKATLRGLLTDPRQTLGDPCGALAQEILAARRATVAAVTAQLGGLAARGELTQEPEVIYRSYVHMHCNRLLGIDREMERAVLGLALRTRAGLEHA